MSDNYDALKRVLVISFVTVTSGTVLGCSKHYRGVKYAVFVEKDRYELEMAIINII